MNEVIYLVLGVFACLMVYCVMKVRTEKSARQLAQTIFNEKVDILRSEFQEVSEREMGFYREKVNIDFERWKRENESKIREDSLSRSRASLKGKITEQIAPMLAEFPYILSDARFLGNPFDFLVVDGYSKLREDDNNQIKIVFVDIKTGNASLTYGERKIKEAVEQKRVSWETIRIDVKDNPHSINL